MSCVATLCKASQLSLILSKYEIQEAREVARSGHCQCRWPGTLFIVQWTMFSALLLCFFDVCLLPHLKSQNWQSPSSNTTPRRGDHDLAISPNLLFLHIYPRQQLTNWIQTTKEWNSCSSIGSMDKCYFEAFCDFCGLGILYSSSQIQNWTQNLILFTWKLWKGRPKLDPIRSDVMMTVIHRVVLVPSGNWGALCYLACSNSHSLDNLEIWPNDFFW